VTKVCLTSYVTQVEAFPFFGTLTACSRLPTMDLTQTKLERSKTRSLLRHTSPVPSENLVKL
jgi:hypothetical protein